MRHDTFTMSSYSGAPNSAVVHEAVEEISKAIHLDLQRKAQTSWKWVALVLGVLLSVGTITSAFGRAFYVPRDEFTTEMRGNAVAHEAIRVTLERVGDTLNAQSKAFEEMTKTVQTLQVDVAVAKPRHR